MSSFDEVHSSKNMQNSTQIRPSCLVELIPVCFLVFTVWMSHFLLAKDFGFYEDDYFLITPYMGKDWSLFPEILKVATNWFQGRPITPFLAALFGFLGEKFGGIHTIYLFGFLIVSLNICLFYFILREFKSIFFALIGALFLCFYPADKGRSMLTVLFILQPGLSFMLGGILLYIKNRKILSYILAACCLLSYETTFFPLFVLPLLTSPWQKSLIPKLFRHGLILVSLIVVDVVIRILTGEGGDPRVSNTMANFFSDQIYLRFITSPIQGFLTSLHSLSYVPVDAIQSLSSGNTSVFFLYFIITFCIFVYFLKDKSILSGKIWPESIDISCSTQNIRFIRTDSSNNIKLLLTGFIMHFLGYMLVINDNYIPIRLDVIYRISSGMHMAASVGFSMMFAALISIILYNFQAKRKYFIFKSITAIVLALYFSMTQGIFYQSQTEYKSNWVEQQRFWSQVVQLTPDIEAGTIVFLDESWKLDRSPFIYSNYMSYIILPQIFYYPFDYKDVPQLIFVSDNTRNYLQDELIYDSNNKNFIWKPHEVPFWANQYNLPRLHNDKVILLKATKHDIFRVESDLNIQGNILKLKKNLRPIIFEKNTLYKYLITH